MPTKCCLVNIAVAQKIPYPHSKPRFYLFVCSAGSPNPMVVPQQEQESALSPLAQNLFGVGNIALAPGVYQYDFTVPGPLPPSPPPPHTTTSTYMPLFIFPSRSFIHATPHIQKALNSLLSSSQRGVRSSSCCSGRANKQ